ncbi:adenylate cyclase [Lachnospiraceae bacterium KM106-2]|nr:adenylate cyclase [Lachnospiraceae bacterium KM106-2]
MNWLCAAVVAFIAFYTWRGYHNGLIKTVFFILAFFVSIILASVISPVVSQQLQKNETIFNGIKNSIAPSIQVDEGDSDIGIGNEDHFIDNLALPDVVKQILNDNNNSEVYQNFKVNNFNDYLANSITCMIINAVSYLVVFAVIRILIRVLAGILDVIGNLPVIHTINKAGGIIIGFAYGVLIVWILCIILMIFIGTETGQMLYGYVQQSSLLTWIYDNNMILDFLQSTFEGLMKTISL